MFVIVGNQIGFQNTSKKTCDQCEFSWWRWFLRSLIKQRKLTLERIGNRLGYGYIYYDVPLPFEV